MRFLIGRRDDIPLCSVVVVVAQGELKKRLERDKLGGHKTIDKITDRRIQRSSRVFSETGSSRWVERQATQQGTCEIKEEVVAVAKLVGSVVGEDGGGNNRR